VASGVCGGLAVSWLARPDPLIEIAVWLRPASGARFETVVACGLHSSPVVTAGSIAQVAGAVTASKTAGGSGGVLITAAQASSARISWIRTWPGGEVVVVDDLSTAAARHREQLVGPDRFLEGKQRTRP